MVDKQDQYNMRKNNFDLSKKNILLTGAAGLLGYEHSVAVLNSNANIIITDINQNTLKKLKIKLQKIYPEQVLAFQMDVTKHKSIDKVRKNLKKKNIKIDVLINNAAIDHKVGRKKLNRFEDMSLEQWNNEINVGLTGAFICSQKFGQDMVLSKTKGTIINVASDLSVIAPDQRIYMTKGIKKNKQIVKPVTYSIIKHALIGLTKYTATYWASEGIRCNAISPGGIVSKDNKEFYNKVKKLVPLNRMAKKNDYHSAIQFLCSDSSSYMTGHNLVIDGGRSIW